MKDRYDLAVDYLCEHPDEIERAWKELASTPHSCLFQFVRTNEGIWRGFNNKPCGCLTMIKHNPMNYAAETEDLHRRIVADKRIPFSVARWDLDYSNPRPQLEVFACWQREIDRVLGRNGVQKETEACEFLDIPAPEAAEVKELVRK